MKLREASSFSCQNLSWMAPSSFLFQNIPKNTSSKEPLTKATFNGIIATITGISHKITEEDVVMKKQDESVKEIGKLENEVNELKMRWDFMNTAAQTASIIMTPVTIRVR